MIPRWLIPELRIPEERRGDVWVMTIILLVIVLMATGTLT